MMEKKTEDKYQKGQRWVNFMGHTLKVMGTIEKWVILRYKRSIPFVKHENEMEDFLKTIDAKADSSLQSQPNKL